MMQSLQYETTINLTSHIILQYCKVCGLGPKRLFYHHSDLASMFGEGPLNG